MVRGHCRGGRGEADFCNLKQVNASGALTLYMAEIYD